ncbi:MAG TPA: recombinase family protein [Amycolatopsis sp.]|uniref:recombinase family protein n=1 Tax=Amycolatopsis sp. TaxID=37632 RepID=UPI002B4A455A|nr:recombinase family protein [Amycolatopsis sp.]HKS43731.1 recombinase family protein [Amycolatopsis sp.]
MSTPVSHAADYAPIVVEHDDGWAQPRVEILDTKRRPVRAWLYRVVSELAWPVAEQERHRTETEAIRGYQQELAHRSRQRRHAHALDRWWAGPPPYGYRTRTHRVSDEDGFTRRLRRLVPDTRRAHLVPLIFAWFLDGHGPSAIAARLATDPDQYPPPHVDGRSRSWTPRVARGVLTNPAYLGFVVHDRTADGRLLPPRNWIWSREHAHAALVDPETFWTAYARLHPHHLQRPGHEGAGGAS